MAHIDEVANFMDYIAIMSAPSKWPLPGAGIRFLTPGFMVETLARHPLTKDCYPTAMGFYPEAAGHEMKRERHDDNLIIYCAAGRGSAVTPDWSGRVSAGDVLILPQGVPHQYRALRRNPWSLYWVHFQGVSSRMFTQHMGYRDSRPLANAGPSAALQAGFKNLMEVRRTGYSSRSFINAANQLRHLLTLIALEIDAQTGRSGGSFNLDQVQAFMREHLDRSLSLEALAEQANLSRFHFANRYKQLTGYSPIKHFLNMKMEHACQLLDSTDMTVQAIAAAVGYDDALYFSRLFKKTLGTSPRSYRASIRN
jgi:AraC-like DNA-binding protein